MIDSFTKWWDLDIEWHVSKSNNTTIHAKNIQKFITEFYKYLYGLSVPIIKEIVTKRLLKYLSITCKIVG